jgi:sugar transferase EpsL
MFKKFIDFSVSALLLVMLLPILLLTAFAIRVALGKPVLFVQQRPGLNGQPFGVYKFRSMLDAVDAAGCVLTDEQRLTFFGKLLRSSSLDELPQLINVLRGDMSLVGPRPLLMEYMQLYTPEQARRHEVRPGITGWAQVNGRNAISWEEKFALDVWYVDHQSLALDMKIAWLTVRKVLVRDGISASGEVTASKFTGTKA